MAHFPLIVMVITLPDSMDRLLCRIMPCPFSAGAMGAAAVATADRPAFREREYPASLRGKVRRLVAGESQPLQGKVGIMETALEGAASDRAHLTEMAGVDDKLAAPVKLATEQSDQLQGGAAVEVAAGADMQIFLASSEFDVKSVLHGCFSSR
jgi:hypothetical protein